MLEIRHILVPTDFTETSDRGLDYAIALAERLGARVTVMHAYEIPVIGFPDGAMVATVDIAQRLAEGSKAALAAIVEKRSGKVPLTTVLREGVAYEEIRKVADELS